jgi:hypothetical protein
MNVDSFPFAGLLTAFAFFFAAFIFSPNNLRSHASSPTITYGASLAVPGTTDFLVYTEFLVHVPS